MIYVSSACSKQVLIGPAVKELADEGFKNIELTGGTRYYDGYESDLLDLKRKYDLNMVVHNYFPPPKDPFILNLASLDRGIYEKSLYHLKKALGLTRLLGGQQFGFHAGFFVDRPVNEIGKKFGKSDLYPTDRAIQNFFKGFNLLKQEFQDISLYIENNCYSMSNYGVYGKTIPFMLLTCHDFLELKKEIDFNLLLDTGHLMVSARTLGLDFEHEFQEMFGKSDYIHISHNDAEHDQNLGLTDSDNVFQLFKGYQWGNKTITLEIYEGLEALHQTHAIVSSLQRGKL